jgi:hypothetical protein
MISFQGISSVVPFQEYAFVNPFKESVTDPDSTAARDGRTTRIDPSTGEPSLTR